MDHHPPTIHVFEKIRSVMELLEIATALFIIKCDGELLKIVTAFILQS